MSDIDLAVKSSKKIESTLERVLGAQGKGLHEKVSSVEGKIPTALVKRIRYIATIRNKLIHEDNVRKINDRPSFKAAVKHVGKELKKLEGPTRSKKWMVILALFLLAALVLVVLYFDLIKYI
ncbi:MAG: DUF4145 domain-containing protein [Gammaproteobacteria bacterium]